MAFILVSTYLSQSRYEDLKGLVSDEALAVMCTKYEAMPQSSRRHLAITTKDIANINAMDIGVWFDDKGGKFASVWIRFLFMSQMLKPGEQLKHVQVLYRRKHQPLGTAGTLDGDRLILGAFYMFHRDFSNENGWIITRTSYSLPE
uniref:m-AAA protease-interacting protein 1, mitochondrial n=1 Tax=Myxine glutinosa TaxID=7769 RepID=UPI00358DEDD6